MALHVPVSHDPDGCSPALLNVFATANTGSLQARHSGPVHRRIHLGSRCLMNRGIAAYILAPDAS
eukprot:366097-Chlamydomonas_euryale.AAC.30